MSGIGRANRVLWGVLVYLSLANAALVGQAGAQTQITTAPFTINVAGSYIVEKNLTPSGTAQSAIVISTGVHHVLIDLNGFTLNAPLGSTVQGISGSTTSTDVTVRNGLVVGWGSHGIFLPAGNARVEEVHAVSNGGDGINVGPHSIIMKNTANSNTGNGITCTGTGSPVVGDCLIVGNTLDGNSNNGVDTSGGQFGTVLFNSAGGNTHIGISLGTAAGYGQNVMQGNMNCTGLAGVSMGGNICNGGSPF